MAAFRVRLNMDKFGQTLRIISSDLLIHLDFINTGLRANPAINLLPGPFDLFNPVSVLTGFLPGVLPRRNQQGINA